MPAPPPPWQRVAVVGNSGAGKTMFARHWSQRTGVEHIEIDALYWEANWTPVSEQVLCERLQTALAAERWIVDGNYAHTRDIAWRRATAVVWLDLPLATCFCRAFKRSLSRARSQKTLWNGNRETWRSTFLSTESLLVYLLRTHTERRRVTEHDLLLPEYQHLEVRRFKKPSHVDSFLKNVA